MKDTEDKKTELQGAIDRAKKLINAIVGGSLSEELHQKLKDWLLNIPENGIAEEALAEWAAQNLKPNVSAPSREEKKKFRKLAGILVQILEIEGRGDRIVRAKRRSIPGRRIALRAAAALVPIFIAAAGTYLIFHKDKEKIENILLYANSGEDHEIFMLPDGSSVALEHGSKLEYSSDFVSDRSVRLDGEALFEVVRDTVHPFSVNNEGLKVIVLGTKFNVKAHNDIPEAEIVLVFGKVVVKIGDHRMKLFPGQKLVLDKSKPSVNEISQAGPGTIMRVTHSDLDIENTPATDALSIVADYFDKKLIVEPELSTDSYLNIVLPKDISIEAAIASLNRLSETTVCYLSGDTVYVVPKMKLSKTPEQ